MSSFQDGSLCLSLQKHLMKNPNDVAQDWVNKKKQAATTGKKIQIPVQYSGLFLSLFLPLLISLSFSLSFTVCLSFSLFLPLSFFVCVCLVLIFVSFSFSLSLSFSIIFSFSVFFPLSYSRMGLRGGGSQRIAVSRQIEASRAYPRINVSRNAWPC